MEDKDSPKYKSAEPENLPVIDGELPEDAAIKNFDKETNISPRKNDQNLTVKAQNTQSVFLNYIILPLIFLTVTLLGGLRLAMPDNAFIFLKPELICLIFAVILLLLYFRANLIKPGGWFSNEFTSFKNTANVVILLTLFSASAQVFNSLLPEKGLPFWIVAFCFFWTLWNNLFAEFNTRRLLQSLGGLFGLAFIIKYLFLANLTAPTGESWWQSMLQNPTQQAFTWLLDLPKFSSATGYIQFFTLILYLIGLFFLKPQTDDGEKSKSLEIIKG